MRLSAIFTIALTFAAAAVVSLVAASFSVQLIEDTSEIGVRDALDAQGMTWAEVQADGLQVTLAGIAPTEAVRFRALSTAGTVVDAARVIGAHPKVRAVDLTEYDPSLEIGDLGSLTAGRWFCELLVGFEAR